MTEGLNLDHDTIVAVATPPGRGGIGVVRISGPAAFSSLIKALRFEGEVQARFAHFIRIVDPATGDLIDEALATHFPAPRSYTGEEVLEVACHGSPVVLEFLVQQALAAGARLARPGEFTQRAFLNARLDLTQAEAVRDLIDASTLHQAKLAAEQLGGALARRLAPTKQALLFLIASLEAGIDFAEDDIDVLPDARIAAALEEVEGALKALSDSFRYGRIVYDGFTLAIVGEPNTGKSSLFNRLLDRERAIVTAVPGTTRDLITERVSIGGIPVELIDTAGLRVTTDEVEALGIAKSHEALASADLVLLVTEADRELSVGEVSLLRTLEGRSVGVVRNKVDLREKGRPTSEADRGLPEIVFVVETSAKTGIGIDDLREAIKSHMKGGVTVDSGLLTNLRQHEAVLRSLTSVQDTRRALSVRTPHEMLMLNLYACLQPLDELTGATTPDDVLGLIFSTFCIGK